jgi:hypothetical protein
MEDNNLEDHDMNETDLREYVRNCGIHNCQGCWNVRQYQKGKGITAAPAIWQGRARVEIPLLFIGCNPSLSGDNNVPENITAGNEALKDQYFDYYQNRAESERKAKGHDNVSAVGYWDFCQGYAASILIGMLGREIERWQDYMLMEIINCYFNKPEDLGGKLELRHTARTCGRKYLFSNLKMLQPGGIVLLGEKSMEIFPEISAGEFKWEKKVTKIEFGSIEIERKLTPVMFVPHPSGLNAKTRYETNHPVFYEFGKMIRQ